MTDIFSWLQAQGIAYDNVEHAAVFTCEESHVLPPMPGARTKNVFLRDGKGVRFFLIVVGHEKRVDLKALRALVRADKLSFASPEQLQALLGVEPGSVTLMGLVNDADKKVEVMIDERIWQAECIQCHPLRNTATIIVPHADLEKFLRATGHVPQVCDVPQRA